MSLHKAIKSGKEHRKEYVGKNYCKAVDPACRNHGGCPWCLDNRIHKDKEKERLAEEEIRKNNFQKLEN